MFPVLWAKGRKMVSQGTRKASLTTFRVADEPEFHKLQKDSSKQETKRKKFSVGFSKRLPSQRAQETQSDESGSASCGKKTQEHE